MLKFRLYYDKDAEEEWLKKMCLNGWDFKKFFLGFYTFEQCQPGEFNYQIDLLDNWSGDEEDYAAFMEDTGVEVVGQWCRWVWLKKRAADGPFEMYTDLESKIAQYNRIKKLFSILVAIEILALLIDVMEVISAQDDAKYVYMAFTAIIALIAMAMLKIVWKCKWKIKQFKRELGMR